MDDGIAKSGSLRPATRLAHAGLNPQANFGIVNPPVNHASTVLYPTLERFDAAHHDFHDGVHYGRLGTPTTFALEEAVSAAEGGDRAIATCSGLAAIAIALLTHLRVGDHALMVDSVYAPTRRLAGSMLAKAGIETTFFNGRIGGEIADQIRPNTRVIYLESPTSMLFEVQDIPAITAIARSRGIVTIIDNTWGSPLAFKPFDHGIDVSVISATKYLSGHSDVMMGMIVARRDAFMPLRQMATELGYCAGPDDCYLVLRGMRTVEARMRRHAESALALATWLKGRPEVAAVHSPALPGDPGHEVWRRDFRGAAGLFAITLRESNRDRLAAMIDGMRIFGLGYSWGGFESLLLPGASGAEGTRLRLHVGLEDAEDLRDDLADGFARLTA
jgi:cystathionine beta-lyase, bacterial